MKSQADLIKAIARLPSLIIYEEGGHDFYFHLRVVPVPKTESIVLRYDRFFCELSGRTASAVFNNPFESGDPAADYIASWKFPKDCDFHKELGKFLKDLQCTFKDDELYYAE